MKYLKQNSDNLMKIGLEIRNIWNCKVSQFFTKHFLEHLIWICEMNKWDDDVIASQFSIQFVQRNYKYLTFQLRESKTCLILAHKLMQNYVYSIIFSYEVLGTCFYIKHFQNVIYKMYGKKWGDDTYAYSYRLFKKCFVKIYEILQFHIFLIFFRFS